MISSVGISTKTFDLAGNVHLFDIVEQSSKLQDYKRRLTRTATLDTGAFIDDRGYFDGDRTVDVAVQGDLVLFEQLTYLIKTYGSMWIMLPDGAFTGNMQRLNQAGGKINITLLLESALT
jgi:hypothetical protein